MSCTGSTGLSRKASAPAATAWPLASSADAAMTGTPRSLKERHRSSPVPPEMSSSTIASAGGRSVTKARASPADSAMSTANPSVCSKYSWYSAA